MKTLLKHTVHKARRILYFPLNFLTSIGAPLSFSLAVSRFTVRVDAPLRRYLLGGRYEV
jgi:hypothetical protein